MSEELGKIEKPPVSDFKKGRKLLFVPLIFSSKDAPAEFMEKFDRYWAQVEGQLFDLELKLGTIHRIYHELVSAAGDEGASIVKELNEKSHSIVQNRLIKGGKLEVAEDEDLLTQITDCQRCISIGLQNQKIFQLIYNAYHEANNKRNELFAKRIDETLGADEMCLVLLSERHQVHFPADIQVFYVAPPALDELNRWVRDQQEKHEKEHHEEEAGEPDKPSK